MRKKCKIEEVFQEQRNSMRADRIMVIRHRLVKRGKKKIDAVWDHADTKNMSISGLLFMSSALFNVADCLDLEIVLSGVIVIYKGLAEVVRVHEIAPGNYEIAVKYLDDKKKTRVAKRHL